MRSNSAHPGLFWYFMVHFDASLSGPTIAWCNTEPWKWELQSSIKYRTSIRNMDLQRHWLNSLLDRSFRVVLYQPHVGGTPCNTLLNSSTVDRQPTTSILLCSSRMGRHRKFPTFTGSVARCMYRHHPRRSAMGSLRKSGIYGCYETMSIITYLDPWWHVIVIRPTLRLHIWWGPLSDFRGRKSTPWW